MVKDKIRVSKSVLGKEEAQGVARVILKDGYLGMGKEVKKFEKELKKFLNTDRNVICVNSGTAALHLAVASVTKPGDEVLVQSLTYIASFQAISATGAVPVACEINPENMCIDLKDAERKITKKTRAILPVHYAGDPGELDKIYAFAKAHKLRVIEDAAHAFGTTYNKKLIGSFGDIVCFSFDGIKNITSGEGGAIVIKHKDVTQFAEDSRLLGIHKGAKKRFVKKRSWEPQAERQGYRYHMSNVMAAIGRAQLKKFCKFKKKRQQLAKGYLNILRSVDGIEVFKKDYNKIVPHIFVIKVKNGRRDELKKYLEDNGVECGVHYYPNHLLKYYSKPGINLPVTEKIYGQILTLPLHPDLTKCGQDKIINIIKKFSKI